MGETIQIFLSPLQAIQVLFHFSLFKLPSQRISLTKIQNSLLPVLSPSFLFLLLCSSLPQTIIIVHHHDIIKKANDCKTSAAAMATTTRSGNRKSSSLPQIQKSPNLDVQPPLPLTLSSLHIPPPTPPRPSYRTTTKSKHITTSGFWSHLNQRPN